MRWYYIVVFICITHLLTLCVFCVLIDCFPLLFFLTHFCTKLILYLIFDICNRLYLRRYFLKAYIVLKIKNLLLIIV